MSFVRRSRRSLQGARWSPFDVFGVTLRFSCPIFVPSPATLAARPLRSFRCRMARSAPHSPRRAPRFLPQREEPLALRLRHFPESKPPSLPPLLPPLHPPASQHLKA